MESRIQQSLVVERPTTAVGGEAPLALTDVRFALALLGVGFAASIVLGLLSDGFHHSDDLAHFQIARWAWTYPLFLLDDWGRPGFTTLYFLPAYFGMPSARIFSAILTAAAVWLASRAAARMGIRRTWLVIVFGYAQPLFFELSLTTLTETALAFYLAAAVFLASLGRWSASAAVLSIGLVTRHEAILFVPVWLWIAHQQRAPLRRLWPVVWAPLVVALFAWWFVMPIALRRWLEVRPTTWYGSGGWLTMLARSLQAWGPAVAALAFVGLPFLWRSAVGRLAGASIIVCFTGQTLFRALGLFESGGYARFLVPVSPLIAIGATAGWEQLRSPERTQRCMSAAFVGVMFVALWIAMEIQLRRPETPASLPGLAAAARAVRAATAIIAGIALTTAWLNRRASAHSLRGFARGGTLRVMLGATTALTLVACVHVLRPGPSERVVRAEMEWLKSNGYAGRPIESSHVYCEYLSGITPIPRRPTLRVRLRVAPIGTILFWDEQFAPGPSQDLPLIDIDDDPALKLLHFSAALPERSEPYVRLYEKVADWNDTVH